MQTEEKLDQIGIDCNAISEFMGGKVEFVPFEGWRTTFPYNWYVGPIAYNRSWEWLMPVIDKINNLGKEYNFTIHKTYCSCSVEKGGKMYKDFHFAHSEIKYVGKEVDAAYKLVVKFLTWYNANKPQ